MNITEQEVMEVIGSIDPTKFDFSIFHPMDHHAISRRCLSMPGGIPRHISMWHEYQAPRPIGRVKCLFGRHEWGAYWNGPLINESRRAGGPDPEPSGYVCWNCNAEREKEPLT